MPFRYRRRCWTRSGGSDAPFNEDLFFGKIDWALNSEQRLELTGQGAAGGRADRRGRQNSVQWATPEDEQRDTASI